VPCKLVEVSAHLAALGKQGGNSGQGFFSAACNDDRFLDLDVVDGTADKSGEGEIQEFASEFFLRCHTELDDVRFVVRRVVVLGIARNRLNIRFGHCTSCLFDNSSVKLCKHDTPFHSCRKARMMSRVWGRHAPTRSLRKCRRIAEVKSQWSTTFSRIDNLWPRDGSCPLPLRSKRIFNKCFRIVKT